MAILLQILTQLEGSAPTLPDIPIARSSRAGRMSQYPRPKRFPKEFKDDVVQVVRSGRLTHEEVAHDFNISLSSLKRWLAQADIDDGVKDGLTSTEQQEIVQLRRDNRRLTVENEILRRAAAYFAKDAPQSEVPAGLRAGRRGLSRRADRRSWALLARATTSGWRVPSASATGTTPTWPTISSSCTATTRPSATASSATS